MCLYAQLEMSPEPCDVPVCLGKDGDVYCDKCGWHLEQHPGTRVTPEEYDRFVWNWHNEGDHETRGLTTYILEEQQKQAQQFKEKLGSINFGKVK